MVQLNIAKVKKRLDGFGILIIDEKHARFLTVASEKINETDLVTYLKKWDDRMGYSKSGPSGGGTGEETTVASEFQKRFYKKALTNVSSKFQAKEFKKLVIMCPEEDTHLIDVLMGKNLKRILVGVKQGNYVKEDINKILENALLATPI